MLVLCTFWLGNVVRATTACNFSSLIWPAGSAPAALASLLFDHPEPQIIGKTQCFATFLFFRAPVSSFFWNFLFFDLLSSSLLFSSLTLPISAFHLSILSEVWLLNFLRLYVTITPLQFKTKNTLRIPNPGNNFSNTAYSRSLHFPIFAVVGSPGQLYTCFWFYVFTENMLNILKS